MKIINSKDVKNLSNVGDNFLEIDLDLNNISRILLQLLYYQEHGIKKFILTYDSNLIKLPVTKVLKKLNVFKLYKLVKNYDISIGFKGFPRCIFETAILRPGLRWYFEGKIFFVSNAYVCDCGEGVQVRVCENCMFNKRCIGVCKHYLDKYGESEFKPLVSNDALAELYEEEFEKFTSEELKSVAYKVLENFKADNLYMRKKIVFVKSFPNNLEESSCERFVYYIYNREDDFEETFAFIEEIFGQSEFLSHIKKYLITSNQLVISFGVMGDGNIRKSFYFNVNDLTPEQMDDLFIHRPFDINYDDLWGAGMDYKDDKYSTTKLYYDHEQLKGDKIKEFISDIPLEHKRMSLKFLNSLIKPLNNVLLDYKYKDKELYSKRLDISLQFNTFRLNQFAILFNINMGEFLDKELLTLSFELTKDKPEKINFYYALKLPEPQDEEEEMVKNIEVVE